MMTTKFDYETTMRVLDAEQYGSEWMPEKLVDAIEWLQDMLDSIPEEYRAAATIRVDSNISYDQSIASIEISYTRPPTASEIEDRRARSERDVQQEIARLEQNLASARKRLGA